MGGPAVGRAFILQRPLKMTITPEVASDICVAIIELDDRVRYECHKCQVLCRRYIIMPMLSTLPYNNGCVRFINSEQKAFPFSVGIY